VEIERRCQKSSTGFAGGIYTNARNQATWTTSRGFLMPVVTDVSSSGISRKIDVPSGMSAMQAALNHRGEGILGECGGSK
jgi:hypothetical protein